MSSVFAPYAKLIIKIHNQLIVGRRTIGTAESCTGGLLAAMLTEMSGSSEFYSGGVSCYANTVKVELLGVPPEMLQSVGAVSSEVAQAMAVGVRGLLGVDFGVSLTGIAGPTGGTPTKPVGTVWCGFASAEGATSWLFQLAGERADIRQEAARLALEHVSESLVLLSQKGKS